MKPYPVVRCEDSVADALAQAVEQIPAEYLQGRRWFGGKGRGVSRLSLESAYQIPVDGDAHVWYCLVRVQFEDGGSDRYAMPFSLRAVTPPDERAVAFALDCRDGAFIATDAILDAAFTHRLYDLIEEQAQLEGRPGRLRFSRTDVLEEVTRTRDPRSGIRVVASEQSNSSIIYGSAFILKLFRRLEEGPNPDLEVLRFLTDQTTFASIPRVAGFIEEHSTGESGRVTAIGALQTFVPNEGDAWQFMLQRLGEYYAAGLDASQDAHDSFGLRRDAEKLGQVTGELHVALASGDSPDFKPEGITARDTQQWIEATDHEITGTLHLLRETMSTSSGALRGQLQELLDREDELRDTARLLARLSDTGVVRTRFHGDYHLGQVLVSEGNFIILDFEGEPARSLAERRAKYTPLRDVAGMLRSLSYAAAASVFALPDAQRAEVEERAAAWESMAREHFLRAYRNAVRSSARSLVPDDQQTFADVMRALELDKAMYELRYELRNRPDWLRVPLRGITRLLKA